MDGAPSSDTVFDDLDPDGLPSTFTLVSPTLTLRFPGYKDPAPPVSHRVTVRRAHRSFMNNPG